MNPRRAFVRKIVYLVVMVAILFPMHFVGQPAARRGAGSQGLLARIRESEGLSQSNLGEIDAASETMKLATLGMDNIAVAVLWSQAIHYQKTKEWDKLTATLEQIKNLQPNFVPVWRYQGWNLSYNVSVEFDDYKDRFQWVKKGILYLREGTDYNQKDFKLPTDIAMFTSSKLGTADESRPFRRMFRRDAEFHKLVPYRENDSWLAGREWYVRGEDIVTSNSLSLKGASPAVFHSSAPLCKIYYARDLEVDGSPEGHGIFGEVAQLAWADALKDWIAFGQVDIDTIYGNQIRLGDFEKIESEKDRTFEELKALAPGLYEKLVDERRSQLNAEEIALVDGPQPQDAKAMKFFELKGKLVVQPKELAQEIPADKRSAAQDLAKRIDDLIMILSQIQHQRNTINYLDWKTRCEYEQTSEMVEARSLIAQAEKADRVETNLPRAKELYAQAFQNWRTVLDRFPSLKKNDIELGSLVQSLDRYQIILKDTGDKLPEDFPLNDIIEQAAKNPSLRN